MDIIEGEGVKKAGELILVKSAVHSIVTLIKCRASFWSRSCGFACVLCEPSKFNLVHQVTDGALRGRLEAHIVARKAIPFAIDVPFFV